MFPLFFIVTPPAETKCWIEDLTNSKVNFVSECYFASRVLMVTRNLDIKLYPVSSVYTYSVRISSLDLASILTDSQINTASVFTCQTFEPSSQNVILEANTLLSSLDLTYDLISLAPNEILMSVTKQYTYPGMPGQIQVKFTEDSHESIWEKNSRIALTFPLRYIAGLSVDEEVKCYQNKASIPCSIPSGSRTIWIDSLSSAAALLPSKSTFEFIGIQEPSAALSTSHKFEFSVFNGINNKTIDYFTAADTQVTNAVALQTIRFLNTSMSSNETYITTDYYNFTFTVPSDTPTRSKIIMEFQLPFADIF